jgi:hypothetical protein
LRQQLDLQCAQKCVRYKYGSGKIALVCCKTAISGVFRLVKILSSGTRLGIRFIYAPENPEHFAKFVDGKVDWQKHRAGFGTRRPQAGDG